MIDRVFRKAVSVGEAEAGMEGDTEDRGSSAPSNDRRCARRCWAAKRGAAGARPARECAAGGAPGAEGCSAVHQCLLFLYQSRLLSPVSVQQGLALRRPRRIVLTLRVGIGRHEQKCRGGEEEK